MAIIPTSNQLKLLREQYPSGTIIELITIVDEYSNLKKGTRGTITAIDDIGQIHILWETGSTLALLPEIDTFKIIKPAKSL